MEKKTAQSKDFCFGYNQAIDECVQAVKTAEKQRDEWQTLLTAEQGKSAALYDEVNMLQADLTRTRDEFQRMESRWREEVDGLRGRQRGIRQPEYAPASVRGKQSGSPFA